MTQFTEIIRTGEEQKDLDFLVLSELSQSPSCHTNATQPIQYIYITKDNANICKLKVKMCLHYDHTINQIGFCEINIQKSADVLYSTPPKRHLIKMLCQV